MEIGRGRDPRSPGADHDDDLVAAAVGQHACDVLHERPTAVGEERLRSAPQAGARARGEQHGDGATRHETSRRAS
ncbi:hypothetical protein GCM10027054_02600 [Isoptericola nanjingensis]